MKYINSFLLLFFILLGFSNAPLMASEDAEIKEFHKTIKLSQDGTMEERVVKEIKLNSHIAFNQLYGETFVVYNPRHQQIKINRIYTRQQDGTIIEMPENAYNEVLPSSADAAPYYNHLKELVITHTGLEIGATIYADYTLISQPGYYNILDINEQVTLPSPITNYSLEVIVPDNVELHHKVLNSNVNPIQKKQGSYNSYQWKLKNVPALKKLEYTPKLEGDIIYISCSTYKNKDEAFNILKPQFQQSLNPQNYAQICKWFELNKQTPTAQTILNYVNQHIGATYVPLEANGYQIRSVDEIYKSAYATSAERIALLKAILDQFKIKNDIAIIYPHGLLNHVGTLTSMERMVVIVDNKAIENDDRLIAELPQTQWWSLLTGDEITPRVNSEVKCQGEYEITVTPEKATAKVKSTIDNRREIKKEEKGIQVSIIKNDGLRELILPDLHLGVKQWNINRLNSSRDVALQIPYCISEESSYTLKLPSNLKIKSRCKPLKINNNVGHVEITYQLIEGGLLVKRSIQLKKQIISPKEYRDFCALIQAWHNINHDRIMLEI